MNIRFRRVIGSLFVLTMLLLAVGTRAADDYTLRLPVLLKPPVEPAPADLIIYTYWEGDQYDIYTIRPDGTGKNPLTDTPENEEFPRWSPDRRAIAFIRYEGEVPHIVIANADGSGERVLVGPTSSTSHIGGAAWSPDGTRLAFHQYTNESGRINVFVIDADGSDLVNLTADLPSDAATPEWSPDGTRIVFSAYVTDSDLHILDLAGGGITPLINNYVEEGAPVWSPDETTILFTVLYGENKGLNSIPAAGGTSHLLIPGMSFGRWSADGASIVFTSENGGIYRAAADGSGVTPVDPSPDAWGPDW